VVRRRFPAALLGIVQVQRATPPRTLFPAGLSVRLPTFAEHVTRRVARRLLVTRVPTLSVSANLRPAWGVRGAYEKLRATSLGCPAGGGGTPCGGATTGPTTTPVGEEVAELFPAAFVAVTATWRRKPASA
jgi:hypothetical protein